MAFSLTITQGPGAGQSLRFDQAEVSFGRTAENDVVLYDPNVSRQHFTIARHGGGYLLEDRGSSNGTKVNGARVNQHPLSPGDQIEVGEAVFIFEPDSAAVARRPRSEPAALGTAPRGSLPAAPTTPAGSLAPSRGALRAGGGPPEAHDPLAGLSARERFRARKAAESPLGRVKFWYGGLAKGKQLSLLGGGGVLLLLAVFGGLRALGGSGLPLTGAKDYGDSNLELVDVVTTTAFGYGVPETQRARDHIQFRFRYQDGRATLYFDAGWIDSDREVEIRLNEDRIVGYAPLAIRTWEPGTEIVLPYDGMIANEFNTIVFDNTKNPGPGPTESWAVSNVRVVEEPLPEADQVLAMERFQLGEKRFTERQIGPENLWSACQYFREARDYLEKIAVKPALYDEAGARLKECNLELKQIFDRLRFTALRHEKFREWKEAKAVFQQMLEYFPDENDHRHKQVKKWLDRYP